MDQKENANQMKSTTDDIAPFVTIVSIDFPPNGNHVRRLSSFQPFMVCPESATSYRRRIGNASQVVPQPPSATIYRTDKVNVFMRVVFCKLGEIDTVKECFAADVFIQARWREETFDNISEEEVSDIDWSKYWSPKLYVDNLVMETKDSVWRLVTRNYNNEAYVYERRRIKGVFLENMELNEFPFDTQDISILILSELNCSQIVLMNDSQEMSSINLQSFVDEQEWKVYQYIEMKSEIIGKTLEGSSENYPSIFYRCFASRRYGFYVWNIYVVMVMRLKLMNIFMGYFKT